jgi:peptidyl-prolyl cis-trans isomerase SurA
MKKLFVVFLFLTLNISLASNTILAIVNNKVITTESFQNQLNIPNSVDKKMELLTQQIDISLQIDMVKKLGIEPKNEEINGALIQLAINNSISLEEIKSHPQYVLFVQQIIETLSLIKLEQLITKDFKPEYSAEELLVNCSIKNSTGTKQIKIAQIIISEILDSDSSKKEQRNAVIRFLEKLSKHISKGASFEAFAKLHSQHLSYYNGGLSEWMFVNAPNIDMFDSLQEGEVSNIYETDEGWAIAIKVDERYVDSDLEKCKEKIIYLKAQKFYADWLKDLRDAAYIKIYSDKL